MNTPKISVIVPTYNLENYIRRCIESVLSQTFQDFEIICVDDSSTDRTTEIIQEMILCDTRIRLFSNESNMGTGVSRRKGYECAKGEYLFFLDGDDTLPVESLNALYLRAQESKSDIVRGEIRLIYDVTGYERCSKNSLPYGERPEDIYRALLEKKFLHNLCATLFSKKLFIEHSYLTIDGMRNGEDAYLFYQLVNNISNGVALTSEIVYNYYCQNMNSSTHVLITDIALDRLMNLYEYIYILPEHYKHLESFVERYLTLELNEWAIRCGYRRFLAISRKYGCHRFVSIKSRIKCLTFTENIRWIVKFGFSILKQ